MWNSTLCDRYVEKRYMLRSKTAGCPNWPAGIGVSEQVNYINYKPNMPWVPSQPFFYSFFSNFFLCFELFISFSPWLNTTSEVFMSFLLSCLVNYHLTWKIYCPIWFWHGCVYLAEYFAPNIAHLTEKAVTAIQSNFAPDQFVFDHHSAVWTSFKQNVRLAFANSSLTFQWTTNQVCARSYNRKAFFFFLFFLFASLPCKSPRFPPIHARRWLSFLFLPGLSISSNEAELTIRPLPRPQTSGAAANA